MKKHHAILIADNFRQVVQQLIPRIERLIDHGFDLHVIARDDGFYKFLPPEVYIRKLPYSRWTLPVHYLLIQSYLIELKPTLVHAFGLKSTLFTAAASHTVEIPAVVASWDISTHPLRSTPLLDYLPRQISDSLEGFSLGKSADYQISSDIFSKLFSTINAFFVHSRGDQRIMEKLVEKMPQTTIYLVDGAGYGVDVRSSTFSTSNLEDEHIINGYVSHKIETNNATKNDQKNLKVSVRVHNQASYDWLIEIILETINGRFDTEFLVALDASNQEKERFYRMSRCRKLDVIEMGEKEEEIPELLGDCDLFIELNDEPDSRMIMLAMSHSVPVITRRTSITRHLLGEDLIDSHEKKGDNTPEYLEKLVKFGGFTLDNDEEEWIDVLHNVLKYKHKLARAKGKARQLAARRFNETKINYQVLRYYDERLGQVAEHLNDLLDQP